MMKAEGLLGNGAPWIERVRAALERWRSAGLGTDWVVAVSGGSDSVGLLRVLHAMGPELGLRLSVAHLNHGARGAAAENDARFVARLAESLGLPSDLGQWQPTRPSHFEADARRARYAWLAKLAETRGASVVAVGHTRDDQAETILHRILRGTGPRGLAGMPSRRRLSDSVVLVRPLLRVSRSEIQTYLASINQDFHNDATNADLARTRARIRHDLLPKLASEYNPRIVEALIRLGGLSLESRRAWEGLLRGRARGAVVARGPDAIVLRQGPLARLPRIARAELARMLWRRVGWPEGSMTAARWLRLAALMEPERGRFSIGGGIDLSIAAGLVRLAPILEKYPTILPSAVELPVPGSVLWRGGRITVTFDPDPSRDEIIDLDRIVLPLIVRAPKTGDRFEPLGMAGHHQSLNDFLCHRRIPHDRRGEVPLVCDREGILWVVGHRIAHRVRWTETTQRRIGLRWEPDDPSCG
jgi:tRNA(Ile)-lysidine synthase